MRPKKSPDTRPVTVIMQSEIRQHLDRWAQSHLTSLSAEVARAVRERVDREQSRTSVKSESEAA